MGSFILTLWMGLSSWALTNAQPALSSDFDTVVSFTAAAYDEANGGETEGVCNGNLISARAMITAAHCVVGAEALNKRTYNIQFGRYVYKTNQDGSRRRIGYGVKSRQSVLGRAYLVASLKRRLDSSGVRVKIGPAEDMAVVVFERDLQVPEGTTFMTPPRQNDLSAVLRNLSKYLPTVVTINFIEEFESLDFRRMAVLTRLKVSSGYLESKSPARVSPGDSGAPLFARLGTEWKQIGVVKGRADSIFSNWDVFGILNNQVCDISRQIPDREISDLVCY